MDNIQLGNQLYQLFNQREMDAVLQLASDSVEMVNVATGQKFKGTQGLRQFMEGWIRAFPDAKITNLRVSGGGDVIIAEFIGTGTHKGPLEGPKGAIPPTGRRVEMRFCEIWDLKNGKLEFGRNYHDAATMMEQLGISGLPPTKELKPVELRPH